MRPRFFASAAAALSAALSASLAVAADPLPLPGIGGPPNKPAVTAPALPAIPNVGGGAPNFLPAIQPQEKGAPVPKPLPVVPQPRAPGEAPPVIPDAPVPMSEAQVATPATMTMPLDKSFHDDHLGPWNTVWVRGGYTYLWIKDAPSSPPLLGTTNAGVPTALLGGQNTNTSYGGYSGATVDAGMWLNERHTIGLGVSGFISEKRSAVASQTSDALGNPLLVRPFYNAQVGGTNANDSLIVSSPERFAGSLAVERGARVDGFEINLLMNVCNTQAWTANFSFGMRYFDLDEYQTVYQVTQSLTGNTIPYFNQTFVNGVAITDRFHTRNQFYGTQFGGDFEYRHGALFADFGVKAALGPVHQITDVSGETIAPGAAGGPGGFLAVGSVPNGNQGRTSTNYFAVLTDVNGTLGIQITNKLRVGLGYQFLYLNTVARPSNQIVTTIDPRLVPVSTSFNGRTPSNTQVGGPGTPPQTPFNRDDFFVHGLRFLFEFQY